jgi:hypothetical protein
MNRVVYVSIGMFPHNDPVAIVHLGQTDLAKSRQIVVDRHNNVVRMVGKVEQAQLRFLWYSVINARSSPPDATCWGQLRRKATPQLDLQIGEQRKLDRRE